MNVSACVQKVSRGLHCWTRGKNVSSSMPHFSTYIYKCINQFYFLVYTRFFWKSQKLLSQAFCGVIGFVLALIYGCVCTLKEIVPYWTFNMKYLTDHFFALYEISWNLTHRIFLWIKIKIWNWGKLYKYWSNFFFGS